MTVSQVDDYKFFPNKYIDMIEEELSNSYFIPVWEDVLKEVKPKVLVDVGCGSGIFSEYLLKEHGCSIVGIDGNQYALEKAKKKGFQKTFLVNDFSNDRLPLESCRYEFVLNKDVLEHLLDPMFLLYEINRILKVNGMLLVHIPYHFPLYGRLKFLINSNLDPYGYCLGTKPWEYQHIRFFTYESFIEMLSIAGFTVIKDLSYHFYSVPFIKKLPKSLRKKIIMMLTKRYPSQFCCGFTVLVKKMRNMEGKTFNKD